MIYFRSTHSQAVILDTVYDLRIDRNESIFTPNSHKLVIKVNKNEDEQQVFKCSVTTDTLHKSEGKIQLGEILSELYKYIFYSCVINDLLN